MQQLDLGHGSIWATSRGVDGYFKRLISYMGNLALAEFMELKQVIEEDFPEGEAKTEFLLGFQLLKSLRPAVTRKVLTHPYWIHWVRSTRHGFFDWKNSQAICSPSSTHVSPKHLSGTGHLNELLAFFSHLVLSAHILSGTDIDLDVKLSQSNFVSLPGTGFSYQLSPKLFFERSVASVKVAVRCSETHDCSITLRIEGKTSEEITFRVCDGRFLPNARLTSSPPFWLAVVETDIGCVEIDNHDDYILKNWLSPKIYSSDMEIYFAPDSEIPVWREHLLKAFELLKECHPLLAAEIFVVLRTVVPVVSPRSNHSMSCSSREFWGAVQCSPHPGIALADVLCHEYRHTLLNALLDADPLIDESSPNEAIFYSPWRPDPRPLVSLLHGIYAFLEVVGFYDLYLNHFGQEAPQADLAEERIISNVYRLQIAIREFDKHAKLTTFGREFFEGIQQRIEQFARSAAMLNLSYRDEILRNVNRHYVQWVEHQGRTT